MGSRDQWQRCIECWPSPAPSSPSINRRQSWPGWGCCMTSCRHRHPAPAATGGTGEHRGPLAQGSTGEAAGGSQGQGHVTSARLRKPGWAGWWRRQLGAVQRCFLGEWQWATIRGSSGQQCAAPGAQDRRLLHRRRAPADPLLHPPYRVAGGCGWWS